MKKIDPLKDLAKVDLDAFHQIVDQMFGKYGEYVVLVQEKRHREEGDTEDPHLYVATNFTGPEPMMSMLGAFMKQVIEGDAYEKITDI